MTALRVDGVDLSHHQGGTLDFEAAKRAGVQFVYHKATEGTTVWDDRYASRRTQVKAAGLPFGAYHFARPDGGDAKAEAERFLKVAQPAPGDLFPMLDLEVSGAMTWPVLTDWAEAFVAVVRDKVGCNPILYTPFGLDRNFGCLLWRPRTNNNNRPPVLRWDIWQFSNGELGTPNEVAGLGHVDLNHLRDGLTVADFTIPDATPEPPPTGPTPVSIQRAKFTALLAESRAAVSPRATATRAAYDAIEAIVNDSPER